MRLLVLASAMSALALAAVVVSHGPATAAKSKMGCDRETEVWNAAAGKCEAGTSKWRKKSAEATAEPTTGKAKAKSKGKSAPAAK